MYFLILRAFASEFFPVINSSALQIEALGPNIVILMHYHLYDVRDMGRSSAANQQEPTVTVNRRLALTFRLLL